MIQVSAIGGHVIYILEPTPHQGLQGDGGAPFKRTSQDIRRNRRNFQRNQRQYPEHRLRGGRASVIGQADISNTRLRAAPAPSRDFFIWRVHKDIGV